MCGRYGRWSRRQRIEELLGIEPSGLDDFTPHQYPVLEWVMRCRVYLLRRRGRRLPWREVYNGSSVEGDLSTHYLSLPETRYLVATLTAPGDALCKPLLPNLYEPGRAASMV